MASKIKMSLTICPENVEIWCKRSGFTVITPLEILQNKLEHTNKKLEIRRNDAGEEENTDKSEENENANEV